MPRLAAPPEVDELLPMFDRHMHRAPVSEHTVRSYTKGATDFVAWLTEVQTKHRVDEVLTDDRVATHAAKDFRSYLLSVKKDAPKTADARMTGVGALYLMLGLPKPVIRSAAPKARLAPQWLTHDGEVAVLRAAEARDLRDHAIVRLMLASGLRIAETEALDVDDVVLSERKGLVIVREGKGGVPRDVPLEARDAIATVNAWKRERRDHYALPDESGPLFVSNRGTRMAVRSIRHMIGRVGESAQVEMHPHTLRHTFCRRLVENGVDIITVAALAGHADPKTTMIYTQPDEDSKRAAVRHLARDY